MFCGAVAKFIMAGAIHAAVRPADRFSESSKTNKKRTLLSHNTVSLGKTIVIIDDLADISAALQIASREEATLEARDDNLQAPSKRHELLFIVHDNPSRMPMSYTRVLVEQLWCLWCCGVAALHLPELPRRDVKGVDRLLKLQNCGGVGHQAAIVQLSENSVANIRRLAISCNGLLVQAFRTLSTIVY